MAVTVYPSQSLSFHFIYPCFCSSGFHLSSLRIFPPSSAGGISLSVVCDLRSSGVCLFWSYFSVSSAATLKSTCSFGRRLCIFISLSTWTWCITVILLHNIVFLFLVEGFVFILGFFLWYVSFLYFTVTLYVWIPLEHRNGFIFKNIVEIYEKNDRVTLLEAGGRQAITGQSLMRRSDMSD